MPCGPSRPDRRASTAGYGVSRTGTAVWCGDPADQRGDDRPVGPGRPGEGPREGSLVKSRSGRSARCGYSPRTSPPRSKRVAGNSCVPSAAVTPLPAAAVPLAGDAASTAAAAGYPAAELAQLRAALPTWGILFYPGRRLYLAVRGRRPVLTSPTRKACSTPSRLTWPPPGGAPDPGGRRPGLAVAGLPVNACRRPRVLFTRIVYPDRPGGTRQANDR